MTEMKMEEMTMTENQGKSNMVIDKEHEEGADQKHGLLLDFVKAASRSLGKILTSALEDKALAYEEVMKYFMEHQDDDPKIARGAMIRAVDRKGLVILTQVFLDKENALVCGKDGAPLGRKVSALKFDAELLKVFKGGNTVLVG